MPLSTNTLSPRKPSAARRRRAEPFYHQEALDDATISELSSKQISRMTQGELVRTVRAARIPAGKLRLEYFDRATLQRLAHQARLCCRQRLG